MAWNKEKPTPYLAQQGSDTKHANWRDRKGNVGVVRGRNAADKAANIANSGRFRSRVRGLWN